MFALFFSIIVFLFGLIVGSFLNCIIYRLETGGTFLKGRSFCPHCKHILKWQDLIPIFSFIFLKGKCRYCGGKISLQYPLVEVATGILFFLIFWNLEFGIWNLLFYWLIASLLIVIFVYDLKHYIIPDKIIYPAIAITLAYNLWISDIQRMSEILLSGLGAVAFFAAIVLLSRGKWMGVGDIKLAFLMGLILGYPKILVALFLTFFIGAIIGIGLVISGRKKLKSEVPFGPFLVAGTFLAMLFGGGIVDWYLNFFLIK
jgi:prepilin signal peptidase PulO-like enzyme (type II secretory pathway)